MPYRQSTEDARIDAVRRTHTVAELAQVKLVMKRFAAELERTSSAVAEAMTRLHRAQQGTSGLFFRTPPDPMEIEREVRELDAWRDAHSVAEDALQHAVDRGTVLDELLAQSPDEPVSKDPDVLNAAVAASVRAAATHGRDVRKFMRETIELVTAAHRDEITMAMTGEAARVHKLPLADHAVALARCRIDLLRASLLALGAPMAAHSASLGAILVTLEGAGTGPGQPWKDSILAAGKRLDDIVGTLERS